MKYCIVHYAEIGTKKGNRKKFEDLLVGNIKSKAKDLKIRKYYGYFLLQGKENQNWNFLEKIPGISNFYVSNLRCKLNLDFMKKKVLEFVRGKKFETFRITSQRHNKDFDFKSNEISMELGGVVFEGLNKKVDLNNPDLNIYVKVCDDAAYFSDLRFDGIGGLPVGSLGEAVCLLSGGIDSPVAAFLAMKRGLKVKLIHFKPEIASVSNGNKNKILDIAKKLSDFNSKSEFIECDFSKVQKQIIMKVPSQYRMLIYRRFMIRIAEKFGVALVMGDNIGQVASQTLENLSSVLGVANGLVLSPLMTYDKKEIVELARKIGTYDLSVKEYPDCCSYFVPRHPELKATSELLDKVEEKLDVEKLVEMGLEMSKKIRI